MMRIVIVTGSAGLIGSESVRHFAKDGTRVVGIDNDMRAQFFGAEASTRKTRDDLIAKTGCKEVRFTVYVKDGKAALKATPVKDD